MFSSKSSSSSNSNIYATGDVQAAVSDVRYKENIADLETTHSSSVIEKLRPVQFTWKNNAINEARRGTDDVGLIAQELVDVFPEACEVMDFDRVKGVHTIRYEKLIPVIIASHKSLLERVKRLEDALFS